MESRTRRPLRYKPVDGEFVIRNGKEFFNRPLYGVSTATQSGDFRVDAGDLPEFSMYLPGHGGNLKIGFVTAADATPKWAANADEVLARYRPGRMIYEIRDLMLGKGMLRAEVLTTDEGAGFVVKVEGTGVPAGIRLAWAFAGVSGRKGQRNGDIGCERQPVSQFFQVRREECEGNHYVFESSAATGRPVVRVLSSAAEMVLTFPVGSMGSVRDFESWTAPPPTESVRGTAAMDSSHPTLIGSVGLRNAPLYMTIDHAHAGGSSVMTDPGKSFEARSIQVKAIAGTLKIDNRMIT